MGASPADCRAYGGEAAAAARCAVRGRGTGDEWAVRGPVFAGQVDPDPPGVLEDRGRVVPRRSPAGALEQPPPHERHSSAKRAFCVAPSRHRRRRRVGAGEGSDAGSVELSVQPHERAAFASLKVHRQQSAASLRVHRGGDAGADPAVASRAHAQAVPDQRAPARRRLLWHRRRGATEEADPMLYGR